MIFEGADGSFSCVAAMQVGWCQLEVNIICMEELAEEGGSFIIQSLELWFEATGNEKGVYFLEGSDDGLCGSILDGLSKDGIAIVVINNKKIVVATGGGNEKFSG